MSISVKLSRRELLLLDRLAYQARRTGGRKLAASVVLRAMIRMMRKLDLDVSGVKTVDELTRNLLQAKRRRRV